MHTSRGRHQWPRPHRRLFSRRLPESAKPAPAQPTGVVPGEAGKGAPPKSGAGAAFRETLWFKQGDVEQMVAEAKAKMQATGKPPSEGPIGAEDARPLEDRYVDDGSVTVEDRKKFSLRTGGTSTSVPAVGSEVPGQKIDEREIVGEISGGRRTLILVIAAIVVLALVVVIVMMVKGKGKTTSASPTSASASQLAATKPPPTREPLVGGLGQGSPDSSVAPSPAGSPSSAPPGKAAPGLGTAGGTTKAGLGGATGETKPGTAQAKRAPAKKKVPVRHPSPKRKR